MNEYNDLDDEALLNSLQILRYNLAHHIAQRDKLGSLYSTTANNHEIDDTKKKIDQIKVILENRNISTLKYTGIENHINMKENLLYPYSKKKLDVIDLLNKHRSSLMMLLSGFLVIYVSYIFISESLYDGYSKNPTTVSIIKPTPTLDDIRSSAPNAEFKMWGISAMKWNMEVYNNTNLDGKHIDYQITIMSNGEGMYGYTYKSDDLPNESFPKDNIGIRFSGDAIFPKGEYRFYCKHQNGCRIIANRVTVIDAWQEESGVHSGDITLDGSMYNIVVEYFDKSGKGELEFWWEKVKP
jgi:hypothetical protein